jgi:NAD(P)-dependent dehydrogenase (short-subunit alcohol dehydrogenase family)
MNPYLNFSLEGKVALVTGVSYGIGFAIASAFAEQGAKICFNDINQELVDKGLKAYAEKGIKVHQALVGNYFTSLEMAGITLTLMKLDDELKECFDLECNSMGLTQYPKD